MRAKDAPRLSTIRLLLAAIKQREVDERIELDDAAVLGVIEKMLKQRRESIAQYEGRAQGPPMSRRRKSGAVWLHASADERRRHRRGQSAITETGASGVKYMDRQVMALLKPRLAGRADMARVSGLVKTRLSR